MMFVFLDTSSVSRHRRLYERELGFRVIENQFHPPHEHHGLVKYDAGRTILAINLFAERKFAGLRQDAVTLVCRTRAASPQSALERYGHTDGDNFTDVDGHHYAFVPSQPDDCELFIEIVELRLRVDDLAASICFYRDVLGLRVLEHDPDTCMLATGSLDIRLEKAPARAPDIRYNACLMVFYTADVVDAERALEDRGLTFTSRSGESDIGVTARFKDPTGHTFCLYQPSAESLTWESAAKVIDLMTSGSTSGSQPCH
jgi:catechol 2,3-dioxygenase-like lactoylglutathione lyase family enzyme